MILPYEFRFVFAYTIEVAGLCQVLAECNAQIRRLELTGEDAFVAGAVVGEVFPGEGVHPAVEELSVRSQCEGEPYECEWPRLDKVLADAPKRFAEAKYQQFLRQRACAAALARVWAADDAGTGRGEGGGYTDGGAARGVVELHAGAGDAVDEAPFLGEL